MIKLRERLLSSRSNVGVTLALASTCLALVWAHSGMAQGHMGHEASGDGATMSSVCVAVLELVGGLGLGLLAWPSLRTSSRRSRAVSFPAMPAMIPLPAPVGPLPRAGPSLLGVFRR